MPFRRLRKKPRPSLGGEFVGAPDQAKKERLGMPDPGKVQKNRETSWSTDSVRPKAGTL
jgi:hypothetical protein